MSTTSAAATPSATTPLTDAAYSSSSPQSSRAATNATAPPPADDETHVLQRARELARRPDVTALMTLRDDVVRRAAERGIVDSSSVKGELAELDLRLNEARRLQLKLDAEEFRRAESNRRAN